MREWIGPALATPGFVLELQPPAQPHRWVAVECPIRLADGAYLEVVRPSAQRAVHLAQQLCGVLPCPRSVCQCMDLLNHALDALLRWPVSQARLTGSRRIHSSERVAQEVGGNLVHLKKLPKGCRAGNNAYAFIGEFRMWDSGSGPNNRGREKTK